MCTLLAFFQLGICGGAPQIGCRFSNSKRKLAYVWSKNRRCFLNMGQFLGGSRVEIPCQRKKNNDSWIAGLQLKINGIYLGRGPVHRIPVTTRIIAYLVGDSYQTGKMPLLLGGGHTQYIPQLKFQHSLDCSSW